MISHSGRWFLAALLLTAVVSASLLLLPRVSRAGRRPDGPLSNCVSSRSPGNWPKAGYRAMTLPP